MDYDKLIERLRNAAGGTEGIQVCQDAVLAIETLRSESIMHHNAADNYFAEANEYREERNDALTELEQMTACIYYKPGGQCRYGGDDPADMCVLGPCPHTKSVEDILGDDYDLDRLRELVEADAEDRCIILPKFEFTPHADPVGSPGTPGPVGHNQELVNFAEDVIRQFGYRGFVNGSPAYITGGLSTLEEAFCIVGWDDPHPAPECECEEEGCHEWADTGRTTPDGYKQLCSKHYWMYEEREAAEAAMKAREQNG